MHALLVHLIVIAAIIGLSISTYIHVKKSKKKKLICPRYSNCETVIHSDYSHVMGIPVEVLGMIYYGFMAIAYTALLTFGLWSTPIAEILLGLSACSVIFSLYLVLLQVFVIKHLCVWCLGSAAMSVLIFAFSYLHIVS